MFLIEDLAQSDQLLKSINNGIFLFQYYTQQIFTVSCDVSKFSDIFKILRGPVIKKLFKFSKKYTLCGHFCSVFIFDFEDVFICPLRAANMLKIDDKDSTEHLFNPVGKYLFTFNNRNTRTRCEICSKLTLKTSVQRHWYRSGVFILNFEHISYLALVFLLITLSRQMPAGKVVRTLQ